MYIVHVNESCIKYPSNHRRNSSYHQWWQRPYIEVRDKDFYIPCCGRRLHCPHSVCWNQTASTAGSRTQTHTTGDSGVSSSGSPPHPCPVKKVNTHCCEHVNSNKHMISQTLNVLRLCLAGHSATLQKY